MGFNDNSFEFYIDSTLTDLGRQRLARNDGSFSIAKFRLGDDEIDYRDWNELTGSDSKDLKILDTPTFEASSNDAIALRYPLISVRNSLLQYLPVFTAKPNVITLKERVDSTGGGVDVLVSQESTRSQTIIPPEIVDFNYIVSLDNDLTYLVQEKPVSITSFGYANYIVPASDGRVTSAGGTECRFTVRVQTISSEVFDIMAGISAAKPRSITTTLQVEGQQSGMNISIPVTITEFATS